MKMEKNVKNGKRHGTKGIEEGDKHVWSLQNDLKLKT